jgi:hypothetical protein
MKTDASGFPEYVRRPGIPNPEVIVSEKPKKMKVEFMGQLREGVKLNKAIAENLAQVKV